MYENGTIAGNLLSGLGVTLWVSIVALVIGAGLSVLISMGLQSKYAAIRGTINAIVQVFRGIPFLLQVFFVYYALPLIHRSLTLNQITTAILVLTISASVNIADNAAIYRDLLKNETAKLKFTSVHLLFILREFGEIIKNSTLLSIIGLTDLFRAASRMSNQTGNLQIYLVPALIYLALYLAVYFGCKRLGKKYFSEADGAKGRI